MQGLLRNILLYAIARMIICDNCPDIWTYMKLETQFNSWLCEVVDIPVITSGMGDEKTHIRRECIKSCMEDLSCSILEIPKNMHCRHCRIGNQLLWGSGKIDYNQVFNASESYVKLNASGAIVPLGHGDCLMEAVGTDLGGDEFQMPVTIKTAYRISHIMLHSVKTMNSAGETQNRLILGLVYDYDNITYITSRSANNISNEENLYIMQVEPDYRIDGVDVQLADGVPVDMIFWINNGTDLTKHGPHFQTQNATAETYAFYGQNWRSIHGQAGDYLENLGVSFDSC